MSELTCQWFAFCSRPAEGVVAHPVLGRVPTCRPCANRLSLQLEQPTDEPRVSTWADGFGRWYARVPRHAAGPLLAARRAIRDVLRERYTHVARHAWSDLERAEHYDTDDTIVYREKG